MNYRALKDLIGATPECAGKTHAEIAVILNTPVAGMVVEADLSRRKTLRVLAARGVISKIYDAARDITKSNAIRSICFAVEAVINAGADGIDTGDAGNMQMMNALVAANVIAQADVDALVAATKATVSRAQAEGLGLVSEGQVTEAMSHNWN